MTRVLIWQWGRRGAMPRFAVELARGCAANPGVTALLSLAQDAEIMPVETAFSLATYRGTLTCLLRLVLWPILLAQLLIALRRLKPDFAIGVHAGPLDPVMALALRLSRIGCWLIIHDAAAHPGDKRSVMLAQNVTLALAEGAIVLSSHVEDCLRAQGYNEPVVRSSHPPFDFIASPPPPPPPPRAHRGELRLLFFGRLLPYKGLNLLADAAEQLGARTDLGLRVVGEGPNSADLDRLRACSWAQVENRWVAEGELGALFAWADVVVLPYTEASQSGVAAAAMAAGRHIIATSVGGLAEQIGDYELAQICAPRGHDLARAIQAIVGSSPCCRSKRPTPSDFDWAQMAQRLMDKIQSRLLRNS